MARRMVWVDNLRTLMVVLVVNFHACITYGHVGDWAYKSPPPPSLPATVLFAMWEAHLQAFFMGVLFFVAGYFADRSLARRGPAGFLAERGRRLGIPVLIYMLAIDPLIKIGMHPMREPYAAPWEAYGRYLVSGRFAGSSGPMWFALALLIFSVLFAAVGGRWKLPPPRLSPAAVFGFAAAVGGVSFLVRLVQPLGTDVLNLRLGFFAQYVAAFVLGVCVSRHDLLEEIAQSPMARRAGRWGWILGPIGFLGIAAMSLPLPKSGLPPFTGGWNLPALAYAVWEQLTGFALALGAISFCRRRLDGEHRTSEWLADRAFGVYLFHAPILVALALLLQPIRGPAVLMAAVLTGLAVPASFAVADVARRIPALRSVL